MCYERYLRRRQEADESREIWRDFARTTPIREPEPPEEATEPEPTRLREAITTEQQ